MSAAARTTFAFPLAAFAAAVVVGALAVHRVALEPGIVGLYHDWTIPPDPAQITRYAKEIYDGWHSKSLGVPLEYPAEYPYWFALALVALTGLSGALISKLVAFGVVALAFACAAVLGRTLRLSTANALLCGAVYALCPVMLNKLIAGQGTYLFGYALLPLVPALVVRAVHKRHFLLGGIALGALAGLVSMQIQLGLVAVVAAALTAAVCARASLPKRGLMLAAAAVVLLVVEIPTVVAVLLNHASTSAETAGTINHDVNSLYANSIAPLDAVRLIGYLTNYDRTALGQWYVEWSFAAYAVAGCAVLGLATARPAVRVFAAIFGAGTLLLVTGVYSPLGRVYLWAFAHVPAALVLRELYHLMAALALLYAVGVGLLADSALLARLRFGRPLIWVLVALFVAPMFSGDCMGQLAAHPYDSVMSRAYRSVGDATGRVAWFPLDQPLAFDGAGAGVEPMFVSAQGSLWNYALSWPVSAVDMYARARDWDDALGAMRMLSVQHVVDRRDFSSLLWDFVGGGPPLHYYLRRSLALPAFSANSVAVSARDTIYDVGGLPMAYGAASAAVVPRRLSAIAALSGSGAVALPFGTDVAGTLPYAVLRDAGDADDEALAGRYEVPIRVETSATNAGFFPLATWWFARPAFADAPAGVVAFGGQQLEVPIPGALRDGVLEVSWIGTPIGGRMRLVARGRTAVIDTQTTAPVWRSSIVRVGALPEGSVLSISTLDSIGAVAIRAIRALEERELQSARVRYAALLKGAREVVELQPPERPAWTPQRRGVSGDLGAFTASNEYRLRAWYVAHDVDQLSVFDADENLVGVAKLPPGSGVAVTTFVGIDAPLHFATTAARVLRWTLERFPAGGSARASLHLGAGGGVVAGTFDGVAASVPRGGRVAVLNVAFGTNWLTSAAGARHVQTAQGTNAWILPAGTAATFSVANAQTRPFRVALLVGTLALLCGLVALGFVALGGPSR